MSTPRERWASMTATHRRRSSRTLVSGDHSSTMGRLAYRAARTSGRTGLLTPLVWRLETHPLRNCVPQTDHGGLRNARSRPLAGRPAGLVHIACGRPAVAVLRTQFGGVRPLWGPFPPGPWP